MGVFTSLSRVLKLYFKSLTYLSIYFHRLDVSVSVFTEALRSKCLHCLLLRMETQRQTSLGCLRSTHKPVVGLIFQSTLLLRRAPFCPCPASVAVNWDFCPHGAYILLRLRHLINKWVNKCISNGGTYNGGKFKHGAGERECRDSADLLGGPGKPAFS